MEKIQIEAEIGRLYLSLEQLAAQKQSVLTRINQLRQELNKPEEKDGD